MDEHCIRLRGGWEEKDPADPAAEPLRLTLPLPLRDLPGRRLRLIRRFQRPPINPQTEALWLRLNHVPGLAWAELNGEPLPLPLPITIEATGPVEIPLAQLQERNVLVFEVRPDLPTAAASLPALDATTEAMPWGDVTLVIRAATS